MKRKLRDSILLCASGLFGFFIIGRIASLFEQVFGESAAKAVEVANCLRIIPALACVVGLLLTINHLRNYHSSFRD